MELLIELVNDKRNVSRAEDCANSSRILSRDLFEQVISDIYESAYVLSLLSLSWFTDEDQQERYDELLTYLFCKNEDARVFSTLALHVSPHCMTKKSADLLLTYAAKMKERVTFHLYVDLHAALPETYAVRHAVSLAGLPQAIENVKYLIAQRRERGLANCKCIFEFGVDNTNYSEAKEFYTYWQSYLDEKSHMPYRCFYNAADYGDDAIHYFRMPDLDASKKEFFEALFSDGDIAFAPCMHEDAERIANNMRKPCGYVWHGAYIDVDGNVFACPKDPKGLGPIGNLRQDTFFALWNGIAITQLRLDHIRGQFWKYPACDRCSAYISDHISDHSILHYLVCQGEYPEALLYQQRFGLEKVVGCLPSPGHSAIMPSSRKPLSICLVSREYPPETGWGGIGMYVYYLSHALIRLGHTVHVICEGRETECEYDDGGVSIHRICSRIIFEDRADIHEFANRVEYGVRLTDKVQELHALYCFDVIEGPNFSGELFAFLQDACIPVVTRIHTHFSEIMESAQWEKTSDRHLSCLLEDSVICNADRVICSTQAHSDNVRKLLTVHPERIDIVPLGIPMPRVLTEKETSDTFHVLFVGRLERRKGVLELAQAIPRVLEVIPTVHFDIVGRDTFGTREQQTFAGRASDSMQEKMKKIIGETALQHVSFYGYLDNEERDRLYAACDMLVAPSLYESFGLIYVEAMAYGKPVIGCAIGGVPEVVKDGETGLLVPPENTEALAEAIIRILQDDALRAQLGHNGRAHAKEHFSVTRMAERTAELYYEAVGKGHSQDDGQGLSNLIPV